MHREFRCFVCLSAKTMSVFEQQCLLLTVFSTQHTNVLVCLLSFQVLIVCIVCFLLRLYAFGPSLFMRYDYFVLCRTYSLTVYDIGLSLVDSWQFFLFCTWSAWQTTEFTAYLYLWILEEPKEANQNQSHGVFQDHCILSHLAVCFCARESTGIALS